MFQTWKKINKNNRDGKKMVQLLEYQWKKNNTQPFQRFHRTRVKSLRLRMCLLTLPNLWHLLPPRGYWEHQLGKRKQELKRYDEMMNAFGLWRKHSKMQCGFYYTFVRMWFSYHFPFTNEHDIKRYRYIMKNLQHSLFRCGHSWKRCAVLLFHSL